MKAVGAAAGSLTFFSRCSGGEPTTKFVGIAFPHAKPARYYYRRPGETATSYDLSYADCALRPFHKYKSRTIIFEGFGYGMGQGGAMGESYVPMHGAMAMFLTGSAVRTQNGVNNWVPQNASLDHYLAQKYGGSTPFRSVELVAESDMGASVESSNGISAGNDGVLKPRMTSPEAIWNKFFGPPLPSACTKPPMHPEAGPPRYVVRNMYNGGEDDFDLIIDYQIELLAQMLICDLTRFATLVLPGVSGHSPTDATLAAHTDMTVPYDFHNGIAHLSEDLIDADKRQASMCRWYYSKVAKLMDYLDAAGTLDSTLILVGNEGGHGNSHSHQNVPLTLHGGANGRVRMGRRILAPGRTPPTAEGDEPGGPPLTSHVPILVGIANAFGDPITSYGTCLARPEFTQGISGFLS